jgi:hypothetical protein
MPRSCIDLEDGIRRRLQRAVRGASPGGDMPMTKILREYDRPSSVSDTEYGLRLVACMSSTMSNPRPRHQPVFRMASLSR